MLGLKLPWYLVSVVSISLLDCSLHVHHLHHPYLDWKNPDENAKNAFWVTFGSRVADTLLTCCLQVQHSFQPDGCQESFTQLAEMHPKQKVQACSVWSWTHHFADVKNSNSSGIFFQTYPWDTGGHFHYHQLACQSIRPSLMWSGGSYTFSRSTSDACSTLYWQTVCSSIDSCVSFIPTAWALGTESFSLLWLHGVYLAQI